MTLHPIVLVSATKYQQEHYGITENSAFVYRVAGSHSPTRIVVWDNSVRINPRNGLPVKYSNYGKIDGGDGKYLSPNNDATDSPVSVLLSPESSVISAHRDSTGTPAGGQVWSAQEAQIEHGDELRLLYPDGSAQTWEVFLTNNGHGVALFTGRV